MQNLNVGGQAVIEGVMMRSPRCLAVAVRSPSGSIVLRQRPWISLALRWKFLRWPFFRGVLMLGESLHNGISALNFSAQVQEEQVAARETPASLWVTVALAVVLALGMFAALPHFLTWGLGKVIGAETLTTGRTMAFHLVDGVVKLGIFLGYVWGISLLPDIRRVFMYHGAEHKSIYAFENREELTLDNVRKYTTLHPRCGTSFLLVVVLVAVVVFTLVFPAVPGISESVVVNQFFFVFIKLLLLFPIAGLAYEVIRFAGKHPEKRWLRAVIWPGLMTQKITTRPPDDDQLEVAIASLLAVLEVEKGFDESSGVAVEEKQEEYESFAAYLESLQSGTLTGGEHVPEAQ